VQFPVSRSAAQSPWKLRQAAVMPASDGHIGYLASNSARDSFTCCQFSLTQSTSPCMGRSRLRPRAVSSYSTRGGTSGNNSLVSNPSLSKLRTVTVSILCEMPGIALSNSENRARPPGSCAKERIKKMLHLSPTLVSNSRTAAGSLWPQTEAESSGFFRLPFLMLTSMCATNLNVPYCR